MKFDPTQYGPEVARVLALDGNGERLSPLAGGECSSAEARVLLKSSPPAKWFRGVQEPEAAMAGLWLYFSCFEEAHHLAQSSKTAEGALWHGILHRQEPDAGNAAYWFRHAGEHPIFPKLAAETVTILKRFPDAEFRIGRWDPFAFVQFCDRARSQPRSVQENAAREIQRAEWQLLFDHCARPAA
jgi:hypothetical protein